MATDYTSEGGTAFVTTPNLTSLENRVRSVLGVHPRFMDFGLGDDCVGHCRYFTPVKFRQLFERNGFDQVRVVFDIDADASREDIEAVVAQSQKRSAVYDMVTNPTRVTVEVG